MKTNLSVNGFFVLLTGLCFLLQTGTISAQESSDPQQSPPSRQQVDLIIKGDHIVSMDSSGSVYKDAAVAVDEGLIVAIGTANDILSAYQATRILEGDNRIVMPGLVNGHSHAAMTLLRGMAEDMALL